MIITFEQVDIQVTQQITHFFLPMYDIHYISDMFVKYFYRGVGILYTIPITTLELVPEYVQSISINTDYTSLSKYCKSSLIV